jgi:acyl-CoA reductase-like NAD-dependent aldehyde dehydrogenase
MAASGWWSDHNGSVQAHDIINPTTAQRITTIQPTTLDDADRAIQAASAAQPMWASLAPGDRARLLRRFADLVETHIDELAALEVANAGHTMSNARWEAGNVRDLLEYAAGGVERLSGRQIPVAGGLDLTFREPLGVVGIIVPWNFPMPIAAWGFAPALAAGNTVVLKPAEWTPLTALRLAELALTAGIPEGVFTVLPGDGPVVGHRFATHPLIAKVCFTGSTAVGAHLMATCATQMKRINLELGGKSANIIFADTDLDEVAAAAPGGVFDNSGQDCCARSRILVHDSVFEGFMERFEGAVRSVVVGDPSDPTTMMGPLIAERHRSRVLSYLDGVDVAFAGTVPDGPGFYVPPTVVLPKTNEDRIVQEEVFGPVVTVQRFSSEREAIALANSTPYGLSGSIWTENLSRAIRVARAVTSGNLSVNSHSSVRYWTPFGGFKGSGIGRELGPEALEQFTEVKNVFISTREG